MNSDLTFLLKLQEFDSALDESQETVQSLEASVKTKNSDIEAIKKKLATDKDSLRTNQAKRKELEIDAETKESLIKKHQAELNSLKSNDAYKAMLGEIDAAKTSLTQIEDQTLDLMEKIDQDQASYKKAEEKAKGDETSAKGKIKNFEDQKKEHPSHY